MTNIYVSPLTAPSFECLAVEAQSPPNEFSAMNGRGKEKGQQWDENANEILSVETTETEKALQHSGANGGKEQVDEIGHRTKRTNSPNVVGTIVTGDEIDTPSGTITTLHLSEGTQNDIPPKKSSVYGFHSFTYGVGGSTTNGKKEDGVAVQNATVWEEESFDADSPNVWYTRTVVDLEENGSPTFHCKWLSDTEGSGLSNDSVPSKETGNAKRAEKLQSEIYISFPNPETSSSSTSGEETATNGKTPLNSEQEENENSREESCHKSSAQKFIRRLSPEGAEHSAVNTQMTLDDGNTEGYLMVPNKRFVCEAQRRETLGSSLGCTPSGRMDDKMYWALEGDSEGREAVDSNCHDRAPLIHSGKPRVRYTIEEGFEEMEEGVPVTCFPCDRCLIL